MVLSVEHKRLLEKYPLLSTIGNTPLVRLNRTAQIHGASQRICTSQKQPPAQIAP